MIDFTEIPDNGEIWELFARDFLQELGFLIEYPPDRGADEGKDFIVTEELKGYLGNYRFRWLVSCKHFAKSGKSVTERDELNIQERLSSHEADGFIGFYSTIASSGLNKRLHNLRKNGKIKDYRIFDCRLIENYLVRIGFSKILMRYLPNNYRGVKPSHQTWHKYLPLNCAVCNKNLLESFYEKPYGGIVVLAEHLKKEKNKKVHVVEDVYWCCKGDCDHILRTRYEDAYHNTKWEDIGDLVIPTYFLHWIFTTFNVLKRGDPQISDEAFEKLKQFIASISQIALREMTEEEKERAIKVINLPLF